MNKRIQELVGKAKFMAEETINRQISKNAELDAFAEKFAELIVLEMCNVLDKAQWDKGEDWVCADGTRIIPQVKEHFGVEE